MVPACRYLITASELIGQGILEEAVTRRAAIVRGRPVRIRTVGFGAGGRAASARGQPVGLVTALAAHVILRTQWCYTHVVNKPN